MEKVRKTAKRCKRCDDLIALFARAPMKKTFGMELSFDDEFRAVFHMPYKKELCHYLMDTHGGVIATLLDNAGWFSAAVHYDSWIATSDLNIRLLEPANKDDLIGTCRMLRVGKRVAMAEMEVRTKERRLVAAGSGTFVVTSVPFSV